ncbi:MAG: hypothetical protein JW822_03290 [Spirochaetales bacterium]|nr:hypothetical protein [Spirochaetales bacterium]
MLKEKIMENEYATLWYYPESKIVHHKFHKFIYGEKFRNILMKGADLFEEKGCTKWLSDDRKNSALPQEDLAWGDANWKPRVMNAGWKHWALLMPDKTAGKLNLRPLVEQYSKEGVTVEIFEDEDEALKWLENQHTTSKAGGM